MTKDERDDVTNLSGAYALNALTPAEMTAFEATIASSEQTRNEVTELQDTAVLLGFATDPVTPSENLKLSIMAKIATMPQLPAEEAEQHEVSTAAPEPEFAVPAAATSSTTKPSKAQRTATQRWFTRPAVLIGSMAAAIALIIGGVVGGGAIGNAQHQEAQADKLAAISQAQDGKKVTTNVTGGGTATVMWSNDLKSAAVLVNGVKHLDSNKVYELWYIDKSGARAAGTFTVGSTNTTWNVLNGTFNAGDTIGVTVEPSGGSKTPTTTPVVAVTTA
jgi:anti-sigma-K factor RskA